MHVAIRADASAQIGAGHLARCLTLANMLAARGAKITFLCCDGLGGWRDRIQAAGHDLHLLPDCTAHAATQALRTIRPDGLVVDHYGCDEVWESQQKPHVRWILAIDDVARHVADCLLDQNHYADAALRYQGRVPPSCRLLLGPCYALLAPAFRQASSLASSVHQVLVSFGGSDPTGETLKWMPALLEKYPDLDWQLVAGGLNPQRDAIGQLERKFPNLKVWIDIDDMHRKMASADLFIGAGGATTWERACLGLPSVVISVSDNQRRLSADWADAGGQIYLGHADQICLQDWCSAIDRLRENDVLRGSLRDECMRRVDGLGAERVAQVMEEISG